MPSQAEIRTTVNKARAKAKRTILAKYSDELDALVDADLSKLGFVKEVKTVWVASNGDA